MTGPTSGADRLTDLLRRAASVARRDGGRSTSWSPAVALAVADLLDRWAWLVGLDPDLHHRVGGSEVEAVARACLDTLTDVTGPSAPAGGRPAGRLTP